MRWLKSKWGIWRSKNWSTVLNGTEVKWRRNFDHWSWKCQDVYKSCCSWTRGTTAWLNIFRNSRKVIKNKDGGLEFCTIVKSLFLHFGPSFLLICPHKKQLVTTVGDVDRAPGLYIGLVHTYLFWTFRK